MTRGGRRKGGKPPKPGPKAEDKTPTKTRGWVLSTARGSARPTGHGDSEQGARARPGQGEAARGQRWRGDGGCPFPCEDGLWGHGMRGKPAARGKAMGSASKILGRGHQGAPWLRGVGAGWKPAWAPIFLPSQRLQMGPGDPGAPSTAPPHHRGWGRSSATSLPQPLPACSVPPRSSFCPPSRDGHGKGWMRPQQLGTPPNTAGMRPPHGTTELSHRSQHPCTAPRCRGAEVGDAGGCPWPPPDPLPLTSRLYLATTLPMELVAVQT